MSTAPRTRPSLRLLAATSLLLVLAGCTSSKAADGGTTGGTASGTAASGSATHASAAPPAGSTASNGLPTAPTAVANVSPGAALPAGQAKGDCPYVSTNDAQSAVGSHIYLTATSGGAAAPVSCWFYFYSSPYNAILTIEPQTFSDSLDAHNAMVLVAQTTSTASSVDTYADFQPGVDLISFQTELYAPDHGKDWACAFAKGNTMVLVRTQQSSVSQDARNVAALIVDKF